jgi:MFS transporter, PAT family, solute carrier family 33 (acetyl-CoA transportor), member 1
MQKLPCYLDVQLLIIMHLFAKIGFAANEAATSLKMVEKGLKREDLAIAVLIDFPFQIIGGWLAALWSIGDKPLRPWVFAFWPRLGFSVMAALIIFWFPKPPLSTGFFAFLVAYTVTSGFASYATSQFFNIGLVK